MPLANATDRVILFERDFAQGFIANEQAYLVIVAPEGHTAMKFEVSCGLSVGSLVLVGPHGDTFDALCGLASTQSTAEVAPGYYYGYASFTSVNGATLRLTGGQE